MSSSRAGPRAGSSRIDSLDGLRALSITIVVLGHASHQAGALGPFLSRMPTGIGVDVFFVVSGYLITRLLLAEEDKSGGVSLAEFYIRRVFRIFPALYVYAAALAILCSLGFLRMAPGSFLAALTFTWNYPITGQGEWWLGHCWSLSVEEQFYVFWPCLLVLLGRRRALRAAIGIVLAEPVIRVLQYAAVPSLRGYISVMGHTRMDMILFGCILSLVEAEAAGREWLRRHVRGREAAVAVLLLVVGQALDVRFHGAWLLPVGLSLEGLCIASLVFWSVTTPESAVGRFLGSGPIVWLGRLSYSLYLWQQLFLTPAGTWSPPLGFPLNVVGALAAATASFYLVERPMLRLRDLVIARRRAGRGSPARSPQGEALPTGQGNG